MVYGYPEYGCLWPRARLDLEVTPSSYQLSGKIVGCSTLFCHSVLVFCCIVLLQWIALHCMLLCCVAQHNFVFSSTLSEALFFSGFSNNC